MKKGLLAAVAGCSLCTSVPTWPQEPGDRLAQEMGVIDWSRRVNSVECSRCRAA